MAANGLVLKALEHHRGGRLATAEELYRQAIAADKRDFDALNLLGALMIQRGAFDEAHGHLRQAVKLRPANPDATLRLAIVQRALGDEVRAEQGYRKVLQMAPNFADGHFNFGNLLAAQGRIDAALSAWLTCIRIDPRHADCHRNLGELLCGHGRFEPALAHFSAQQGLRPNDTSAYFGLGRAYAGMGRFQEAAAAFERAVALDKSNAPALIHLIALRREIADWDGLAPLVERLLAMPGNNALVSPAAFLDIADDPALQLRSARAFVEGLRLPKVAAPATVKGKSRLRIAFLSPYLTGQASHLTGVLAAFDRERYEIHAVVWGHDEAAALPARLTGAVEVVHQAGVLSDKQVADKLLQAGIHLAVDLAGHAPGGRPGIFARRPAPVQVLLPGYHGTTGSPAMDYIIADAAALPSALAPFFTEQIVHLPHSIFPQTNVLRPDAAPARHTSGLTDGAFVFCCFNGTRKITPPVFAMWMALLDAVPASLLWLADTDTAGKDNLRKAAVAAGIAGDRLVFAGPVEREAHLARLRYANLVLDTLPHNADLAIGDALWTGVPAIASAGVGLAARRSAALLRGLGLPELVANDLDAVRALALDLATHPKKLKALRTRLEAARAGAPPFDAAVTARLLGKAFERMIGLWREGKPAEGFTVEV